MTRILVTGGTGFVGREILSRLAQDGFQTTLAVRKPPAHVDPGKDSSRLAVVGDISAATDWREALEGCSAVLHLAGQVPRRGVTEEMLRRVNDEATLRLVEQSQAAGIKRFVFMSSMAAITDNAAVAIISDDSPPRPVSTYGRSKSAGEKHVSAFAAANGVGISLRPPMIYGAAAGGSWGMLQRLAATGLPLPFAAVNNRRSAIAIENVVSATIAALTHEAPASGGYVVADTQPLGLGEMVRLLRAGMGLPARLIPVPPALLSTPLRMLGKTPLANSLFGDLIIDSSRFRTAFDWTPEVDPREAILRSGQSFMAARKRI